MGICVQSLLLTFQYRAHLLHGRLEPGALDAQRTTLPIYYKSLE